MSGYTFDANIVIDALDGLEGAMVEIRHAVADHPRAWISRMAWIEVLSKGSAAQITEAEKFLAAFGIDEIDGDIAAQAAALRRARARLKSPDAIILATAQLRGRILVTRNIKDFPPIMPGIRVPYTL